MSVAGTWEADELAAGSTARVRFTSGASYEGGVQDGLYHGEGKYTWADGSCESTAPVDRTYPSTHCGGVDADILTCVGWTRVVWDASSGYHGGWFRSKCHGHGRFCDKQGTVYEGQYYQSTGPGLP